jgi:hypothetical protein
MRTIYPPAWRRILSALTDWQRSDGRWRAARTVCCGSDSFLQTKRERILLCFLYDEWPNPVAPWTSQQFNSLLLEQAALRIKEDRTNERNQPAVDVSWNVPICAGTANGFCRTAFYQCAHGTSRSSRRSDERHFSACLGCDMASCETLTADNGDRILDHALRHLCELADNSPSRDLRHRSTLSNYWKWPCWTALARVPCNGRLHVGRHRNRLRVCPRSLGSSAGSVEMIWSWSK